MLDDAERRIGQSDVEMMLAIAKTRFRIGDAQKSMDLLAKVDRIAPDDRTAALLREQIQFASSQVTPAGLARQVEPQDKIR
jgi:hypothetical protein